MGKPQYLCESTGRMKFGNSKKFNIVQRTEFFMDYIKDSGEFFQKLINGQHIRLLLTQLPLYNYLYVYQQA